MSENTGWVKLHRQSLESSVFKNANIWFVWCWCLLKANHETHEFPWNGEDLKIEQGQFITGREKAIKELKGVSEQQFRTILKYLENSERITLKSTNKFTLITVLKWHEFQKDNQQTPNKHPTNTQQITTYKNDNNEKNDNNYIKSNHFIIPTLEEVITYCSERANMVDPESFIDFYTSKGWKVGNAVMKDWRAAVRTWEKRNTSTIKKVLNLDNIQ